MQPPAASTAAQSSATSTARASSHSAAHSSSSPAAGSETPASGSLSTPSTLPTPWSSQAIPESLTAEERVPATMLAKDYLGILILPDAPQRATCPACRMAGKGARCSLPILSFPNKETKQEGKRAEANCRSEQEPEVVTIF